MKQSVKMLTVGLTGAVLGASGMSVLHAQTATAPAFLIANTESVGDNATYQKYRAEAPKTEGPYGAHFLARGATPVKMDASQLPVGTVSIIQFPSMKALQDWWNSPAYQAIKPLRENSTKGRIYAIEGLPPS